MNELERRLDQPLLRQITELLPKSTTIYLVGGAVRDALLDHSNYDFDFVTGPESMRIARQLADELGGAYFPLDVQRKVARIVLKPGEYNGLTLDHQTRVDFSAYQGADLEKDLMGRDFTFNAIAVDIHHLDRVVDPMHGASDLAAKRLRACSASSFINDPIRILRAVRFSVDLKLNIVSETLQRMREAVPEMRRISAERIRDELFRMLINQRPATSLRILDNLDILVSFLPELAGLKLIDQSPPHVWDGLNHTLSLIEHLETILDIMRFEYDSEKVENLSMGMLSMQLGRYRAHLEQHLEHQLNPDRSHRGILFLAGLYHDVGKQATQTIDSTGRIRFLEHERVGSSMVKARGEQLKLANNEIDWLVTIVKHHMRPSLISHTGDLPSSRAVYRFFRDTGAAGIDICLISLADVLATYGPMLPQERWANHLAVIKSLMQAWWEEKDKRVFPPVLISGSELMQALGISTGPVVGYLLEAIREGQIDRRINTKDEAIKLAEKVLAEYKKDGLY